MLKSRTNTKKWWSKVTWMLSISILTCSSERGTSLVSVVGKDMCRVDISLPTRDHQEK